MKQRGNVNGDGEVEGKGREDKLGRNDEGQRSWERKVEGVGRVKGRWVSAHGIFQKFHKYKLR